jgi:membrane protease YdiL (CAAX protease family)
MEPESPLPESPTPQPVPETQFDLPAPEPPAPYVRDLRWVFYGPNGLRAGWSVLIFVALMIMFTMLVGTLLAKLHLSSGKGGLSVRSALFSEFGGFVAMIASAAILAMLEHRSILDYNLRGPRRALRFSAGLVIGFLVLSALVGSLDLGGWLHFGPVALSGAAIVKYALLWGCTFLLVGCVEEGLMRCYLLFTLARGLNFWWALGLVAAMCVDLVIRTRGNGVWGVYGLALLGLIPCAMLFVKKAAGAGFWYATWVTSTFFAFGHTGNNGENWIGIFAAGAIGAVFCVSVRLAGSAWWAIGCHAAWDWAETYFYGTADSGLVAKGHLLTTSPAGPAFWSGGTDGPEGSVLVLGAVLLILLVILALYGRRERAALPAAVIEQPAS